jgi:hypothetical protein
VVVVLGIAECDHPGYDQTVCQTLDGHTRLYTMPFSRHHSGNDEDVGADGGGGAALVRCRNTTMWQLSFPATEQEGERLRGQPELLLAEARRRCGMWHGTASASYLSCSELWID